VSDLIDKDKLIADIKKSERSLSEANPNRYSMRIPLLAVIEWVESGKYDAPEHRCASCGREISPADTPRMCVGCAEGETDERSKHDRSHSA
jgi:uncharacterized membrane-anchored protein